MTLGPAQSKQVYIPHRYALGVCAVRSAGVMREDMIDLDPGWFVLQHITGDADGAGGSGRRAQQGVVPVRRLALQLGSRSGRERAEARGDIGSRRQRTLTVSVHLRNCHGQSTINQ